MVLLWWILCVVLAGAKTEINQRKKRKWQPLQTKGHCEHANMHARKQTHTQRQRAILCLSVGAEQWFCLLSEQTMCRFVCKVRKCQSNWTFVWSGCLSQPHSCCPLNEWRRQLALAEVSIRARNASLRNLKHLLGILIPSFILISDSTVMCLWFCTRQGLYLMNTCTVILSFPGEIICRHTRESQPTGVGVGVGVGRAFCKYSVIGQGMKYGRLIR